MKTLSITEARKNIYALIDEAATTHKQIQITGKRNNAILVSEEDWNAIQETLYLSSIPGVRKSIIEGLKTPLSETSDKVEW